MPNPVGVTIAMRKKQQQQEGSMEPPHAAPSTSTTSKKSSTRNPTVTPSPAAATKKKEVPASPKTAKPSSWQVFCEGAAMYLGCLILPSLLGYMYQWYLTQFYYHNETPVIQQESSSPTTMTASLSDSAYSFGSYYYESLVTKVCPDPSDVDPSSYTAYVCPAMPQQQQGRYLPLYSEDTAWSDVQLISFLSLLLAVCRGLLVHYLVPRDYESIEALLRCKSSHMLSSDYSLGANNNASRLDMPGVDEHYEWEDDDVGLRFDESERDLLSPDMNSEFNDGHAPAVVLLSNPDLYSAPRFATAVFRLLYTASAVVLAFYSFHGANFWPWYVLGSGSTKNCWDLSGGLTLGMDSDFDKCNSTLRRYFLWQASYHWHSGAFHVWSIAMLLKNPNSAPRRFLSMQSSSANYLRSMLQHALLLVAIGAAYIFSSLRRLGAIGMFAFDVSSCFLHLLQICTNAPESSWWRRSDVVWRVYYLLVLPSYIVTRLVIWPLLWYSATFESEKWLRQFEQTLVPGSARILKAVMHVLMTLLMVMTVIHFRRLCKHSHVQRALQKVN